MFRSITKSRTPQKEGMLREIESFFHELCRTISFFLLNSYSLGHINSSFMLIQLSKQKAGEKGQNDRDEYSVFGEAWE